ncbi:MAG: glycyl-tRNA synthetase beta chain [Clostridia bacterium]|nr:glycyl-tRNA synthetase beta chain [Clostridia bacterium]
MPQDLLLEIGTEEIPARFMSPALEQMEELGRRLLQEARLRFGQVAAYGTPRRLALYVTGLEEKQEDVILEIKGPPVKVAFDAEGRPTRAAEGFARSQGLTVGELVIKELETGAYVFARKPDPGRSALEVLPSILRSLIEGLSFPKTMRWGRGDMHFVRPIRWLVAIYGEEVVPLEVNGIKAGRETRGHRFLAPGPFVLSRAGDYFSALDRAYVIVDHRRRRLAIWEQVQSLAARNGGYVEEDPELLEEITFLLEYPTALAGNFKDDFLSLPEEVIVTPMRQHQRYFPVRGRGGKLLPLFIAVHNGTEKNLDIIRRGNEKVLQARLTDAEFFYREDLRKPLYGRVEELKAIIFQEKLGTLWDKVNRLKYLAGYIASRLDLPAKVKSQVERTAWLAKADLVTSMVYEFPELQGVMGSIYAAAAGEEEAVCQGIRQHYWPRFTGDRLPESFTGITVGLADRIDTLVGYFGLGLIPSGSQDPYALRRQAQGMAAVITGLDLKLSLSELIEEAYAGYRRQGVELNPLEEIQEQLGQFFRQRLEFMLAERNLRHDVVEAVLAAGWDDLAGAYRRALDLSTFLEEPEFPALLTAFTRAFNLARQAKEDPVLHPEALQEDVERDLYRALQEVERKAGPYLEQGNYLAALQEMAALRQPIDSFFDGVLVMTPDPEVRRNRLALLQKTAGLVRQVADFSRLQL